MTEMKTKVKTTIEKFNMLKKGEPVICALSGGADSVALLLCLKELGYEVKACHVNHLLRGEESFRDENFCRELCKRLDVELFVRRKDAAEYSKGLGKSVEEGARVLRYEIFSEFSGVKIATAHTLSDSLETTLFRLARGTGLDGLVGIPPVRDNVIRPIIECTREEVESFLAEKGQDFVTDSTNLSDDYSRNKIRHIVLPALEKINRSLEKTYLSEQENFREDSQFLNELADGLYKETYSNNTLDSHKLAGSSPAISGRVLRRFLLDGNFEASRENILRIRQILEKGGRTAVKYVGKDPEFKGKRVYAAVGNGRLFIETDRDKDAEQEDILSIKAEPNTDHSFFGRTVRLELIQKSEENANVHENLTKLSADYGKIKGGIVIRRKSSGDRVKLTGREHSSAVKKLLSQRFSPDKRPSAVILADDEGVIFVEGFGFAERVRADDKTKIYLVCKIS